MAKKILIIDDEEGIRESLKLILEDHYDLILTDSGPQGLEILGNDKNHSIGLVLLDIKMPRVNGLDTLKEIKDRFASLPVIIVTGYRAVETAAEATKLGASGYIVKPFKADEVLKAVSKNLSDRIK